MLWLIVVYFLYVIIIIIIKKMFYVLCNVYDASCGVYCKMRVQDILNPVFSVDEVAHFWPG